jgi:hypothetical protein
MAGSLIESESAKRVSCQIEKKHGNEITSLQDEEISQ